MGRFETYRAAKLRQLAKVGPFLMASLSEVNRRCGNPNCKCAKGKPHKAHVLTYKVKGRSKAVHVPKDMVKEVKEWVREHKRLKALMKDISRHSLTIVHQHVQKNRAARRGKAKI